jgi:hypothetical protein
MTAVDLTEVLSSAEFREQLADISGYSATHSQERPIVFSIARLLWKMKHEFVLEHERTDLWLIGGARIEFKFNYDTCCDTLRRELDLFGNDLPSIVTAMKLKEGNRGVLHRVYNDICKKKPKPDLFVWIICSRDLSNVDDTFVSYIPDGRLQKRRNAKHQFGTDLEFLRVANHFLKLLQSEQNFAVMSIPIETNREFRSVYHFFICDFSTSGS